MKEKDITKEVLAKAKQIAEHWRMEIYAGCWIRWKGFLYLVRDAWVLQDMSPCPEVKLEGYSEIVSQSECIPIPTIADCLEKLRELKFKLSGFDELGKYYLTLNGPGYKAHMVHKSNSKSFHEALLSALLEVLEVVH